MESDELAQWVGAIGSILALVGAAYFPIWHLREAEARRTAGLRESLGEVASDLYDNLWLLTNCFASPIREEAWMEEYLQNHRHNDFDTSQNQLNQFLLLDLPPGGAKAIGALSDAVAYAKQTVAMLPGWIEHGFSNPEVVRTLQGKRDQVGLACRLANLKIDTDNMLNVKAGIQQAAGQITPEPIMLKGIKVYCRYCVQQADIDAGQPAYAVAIQLIGPYGPPHSALLYRSQVGWKNQTELRTCIIKQAEQMIDSWDHDGHHD